MTFTNYEKISGEEKISPEEREGSHLFDERIAQKLTLITDSDVIEFFMD